MFSKNFFNISDFAKISGLTRQTLIYYDKIGLLKPEKVAENKYRMYSREQISVVSIISILSSLGVPLKKIAGIVRNISPKTAQFILETQAETVREKVEKLTLLRDLIDLRLNQLSLGNAALEKMDSFSVVNINEDVPLFVGAKVNCAKGDISDNDMIDFCERCKKLNIPLIFALGYIKGKDNVLSDKGDMVSAMFMRLKNRSLANGFMPAGKYVIGYARGDYGKTDYIYKNLSEFLKSNGLSIIGDVYEENLHDEMVQKNPANFVMQISARVE